MNEFEELLSIYPKDTPNGRKLHGNKEGCRKKYLKLVKEDSNLHDLVIKCIKVEILHKMQYGAQNYWKMLQTYINQKGWELYEDSTEKEITYDGERFA